MVDFGRVAFGNLRLQPPAGASGIITAMRGNAWLVAFNAHGEVPAVERKGSSVVGVFRCGEGISSLLECSWMFPLLPDA
jgi:hypothetical protein